MIAKTENMFYNFEYHYISKLLIYLLDLGSYH